MSGEEGLSIEQAAEMTSVDKSEIVHSLSIDKKTSIFTQRVTLRIGGITAAYTVAVHKEREKAMVTQKEMNEALKQNNLLYIKNIESM